jgi:hypothetical protein
VSQYEAELYRLHPFREGNTRSTTTFVRLLGRRAGWEIAWEDCDYLEMKTALAASLRAPQQEAGRELEGLIESITTRGELRSRMDRARENARRLLRQRDTEHTRDRGGHHRKLDALQEAIDRARDARAAADAEQRKQQQQPPPQPLRPPETERERGN